MKEFFKKIWKAICSFFKGAWDFIRNLLRKIWDWFVKLLYKIPFDKYLHFIAGLIIAAFLAIVFKMGGPFFAALFAGIAKEVFDFITTGKADGFDLLATCVGGLIIQIFVFFA